MAFRTPLFAAAISVTAALASANASAQSSPLSRSFSAPPPMGGSVQVPSLWYYGPSYSLRYDRPPPGGAGPSYRPSLRSDPFYGPDYLDRVERGQRFGPIPEWPYRFESR